jgi:hypothetical protein
MVSLDSDNVKLMAATAESTSTPSPCDDRLNGGMEKLEEVRAELCAVGFEQWHDDGSARAGQSYDGDGGLVLRLSENIEAEEEAKWSEGRAVDVVAALRPSQPDWWARGWRMDATVHLAYGHGLRPVSHPPPPRLV